MRALIPFIRLFRRQLWWLILGAGLAAATLLASVGLLSLSGWFLSAAAYAGLSYQAALQFNFFLPAAGVRFFSLVRIGARYGERVVTHEATFKLLADLRLWFYKRLVPLAPAHLANYKSGDLLNRLVGDIDALDNLYIRILLPVAVFGVVALTVLFYLSWFSLQIAVISVGLLVAAAVLVPLVSGWLARGCSRALATRHARLKTESVAFVQGLAELSVFQAAGSRLKTLGQHSARLLERQRQMSHFSGLSSALMTMFMGGSVIISLWLACGLVNKGVLSGANIALIALTVMAMYESVQMMPVAFQYLGKTIASARRILEVTETEPAVAFGQQPAVNEPLTLALSQVSFSYGEPRSRQRLLDKLDLTLNAGDHVALVGATGCGKSTLMAMIARLWVPQGGKITVNEVPAEQFSEPALRQMVVMTQQQDHVFNMSVRENLLLANPDADEARMWTVLSVVQLSTHIQSLEQGLDTPVGENGGRLSGGQRKRLILARVLMKDAGIYMLDEPTEGLDKVTEAAVVSGIRHYLADKIVVMATHSHFSARRLPRVLRLENGQLNDLKGQ